MSTTARQFLQVLTEVLRGCWDYPQPVSTLAALMRMHHIRAGRSLKSLAQQGWLVPVAQGGRVTHYMAAAEIPTKPFAPPVKRVGVNPPVKLGGSVLLEYLRERLSGQTILELAQRWQVNPELVDAALRQGVRRRIVEVRVVDGVSRFSASEPRELADPASRANSASGDSDGSRSRWAFFATPKTAAEYAEAAGIRLDSARTWIYEQRNAEQLVKVYELPKAKGLKGHPVAYYCSDFALAARLAWRFYSQRYEAARIETYLAALRGSQPKLG